MLEPSCIHGDLVWIDRGLTLCRYSQWFCSEDNKYMRKDIEFKSEDGVPLRAWHYVPDERWGRVPTIVMAHGFSDVKEMYLDRFAAAGAPGFRLRDDSGLDLAASASGDALGAIPGGLPGLRR